jgi:hypothetical protein
MVSGEREPSLTDRLTVPIHPPLVAAFFVLFLFAENAIQMVTIEPLWIPLLVAIAGGVAALLVGALLLRDWLRGGLLATGGVILFFSFGHAWIAIEPYGFPRDWLVALWLVLAFAVLTLAMWARTWVRPATLFLNLAAALLVIFNSGSVIGYAVGGAGISLGATRVVPLGDTSVKPDIYYIVLDRYGNSETMERAYGYDNTPFLDELRARGFAIADDAWANHFKTALSLSSSFNMDYLQTDNLPTDHPSSFGPVFSLLSGHRAVPDTLTSLGYEYIHIGNYWEPTASQVDADRILRFSERSAFAAALYQTTALSLLSPPITGDDDPETLDFPTLARQHTIYAFDQLEASVARPGPTYTFAHILVPHPPYVFNADGSFPSRDEVNQRGGKVSYIDQLEYANARVLKAIDTLQDVPADQQPVIVLMADEGPFPNRYASNEHDFDWLEASDLEIQQKFGILNALYLPGGLDPTRYGFGPRTSPVNEFRIVFNVLWDARLDLLPDLTYLSPDYDHLYDFVLYPR